MTSEVLDLSPAALAWLRPRAAANAVFQRVRWLTPYDWLEMLRTASSLTDDEAASLAAGAADLAECAGLTQAFSHATPLARGACVSAWSREVRRRARETGETYPLWNDCGHDDWRRFAVRVELHTASLVVDEWLAPETRNRMRLPSLPEHII